MNAARDVLSRSSKSSTAGTFAKKMDGTMRLPLMTFVTVALLISGSVAQQVKPAPEVLQALAPTGTLRVGLYLGNPSSLVSTPVAGRATGVGFELGRELARWLDVPYEPVIFPNNGAVLEGVRAGTVDVVFTNATTARSKEIDFTQPYLEVEAGYLVPPRSAIVALAGVDAAGVRVGVMAGSTSSATLPQVLEHASVITVPTLDRVIEMLMGGDLDAFATNKSILFSDRVRGAKVLDGRYAVEQLALGIPKGREAGLDYARRFIATAISNGLVKGAIDRAGFRGGNVKTGV